MTARPEHRASPREIIKASHQETPYFSLVIPVFNEAGRIQGTLERVARYLGQCGFSSEIFVIDDGSTDGSAEAAMSAEVGEVLVTILRLEKNSGKGYAVQHGTLCAKSEVILICDADLSIPIDYLAPMLHRVREGFDLVIASRALADSRVIVSPPQHRAFLGRQFNRLVRWLLVEDIADTQCGFKLITRRAAQAIFPRQRIAGFAFDVEVLFLAQQLGFTVTEVPVRWQHVGPSHVRPLKHGMQALIDLLRIKWRWWKGGYRQEGCRQSPGRATSCREALSTNNRH